MGTEDMLSVARRANILVYEWEAWEGFLISHLVADYCRIPAAYEDTEQTVARYLSPNIKAVLLQINLSRQAGFPRQRQDLIACLKDRRIKVLNEQVTDITKANLHRLLAAAGINSVRADIDGDPDEPLFVKSNLNYGGEVEQRLPAAVRSTLFGEGQRRITAYDQYYRTSRAKLDPAIWRDESVVIERYISNSEDSFYRVYGFGDSLVVVKAHNNKLIKKISGDQRDHNLFIRGDDLASLSAELPGNLQTLLLAFLNNIEVDYFCLDIVHDTENFYIVDMNTTPYSGTGRQVAKACDFLCQGAKALLQ